jgi:hypothetical protein
VAPLLHGVRSIVDEADFDAKRWYGTLAARSFTRILIWIKERMADFSDNRCIPNTS